MAVPWWLGAALGGNASTEPSLHAGCNLCVISWLSLLSRRRRRRWAGAVQPPHTPGCGCSVPWMFCSPLRSPALLQLFGCPGEPLPARRTWGRALPHPAAPELGLSFPARSRLCAPGCRWGLGPCVPPGASRTGCFPENALMMYFNICQESSTGYKARPCSFPAVFKAYIFQCLHDTKNPRCLFI